MYEYFTFIHNAQEKIQNEKYMYITVKHFSMLISNQNVDFLTVRRGAGYELAKLHRLKEPSCMVFLIKV